APTGGSRARGCPPPLARPVGGAPSWHHGLVPSPLMNPSSALRTVTPFARKNSVPHFVRAAARPGQYVIHLGLKHGVHVRHAPPAVRPIHINHNPAQDS